MGTHWVGAELKEKRTMWTLGGLIGGLGLPELLVIFAVLMLIFGASKLPQLGRGIGEGIRNLKAGLKSDETGGVPERRNAPREE